MIWRLLALAEQLDDGLLRQVFTHSSWVAERGRSYERLEFLGDSVLSLAVTTELYRRFPDHSEGSLARLRAYIVSRATCAKVATRLGLPEFVRRFGTGHETVELDQLVSNENILADMTESLIGAVYLTYGLDVVRPTVIEAFAEHISFAERSYVDFKTELQEQLAKNGRSVVYQVVETVGPPHSREFVLDAVVDGVALGRGVGASKKRAEQDAAAEALRELSGAERPKRRRARGRRRGAGADSEAQVGDAAALDADDPGDRAAVVDQAQDVPLQSGPEPETVASDTTGSPAAVEASDTPVEARQSDTAVSGAERAPIIAPDGEPPVVESAPAVPESVPAVEIDVPAPVPESAPVGEPDIATPVAESAPAVEPDIATPVAESAPADEADVPAPFAASAAEVETSPAQTGAEHSVEPAAAGEPAPRVVFEIGAATRGDTALRSYSVEVSDDTAVVKPSDAAARPADGDPAADEPDSSGDPADAGEPHDAHDTDGADPAADQGARPPQADGGV
jgi:ribonuclease-3